VATCLLRRQTKTEYTADALRCDATRPSHQVMSAFSLVAELNKLIADEFTTTTDGFGRKVGDSLDMFRVCPVNCRVELCWKCERTCPLL